MRGFRWPRLLPLVAVAVGLAAQAQAPPPSRLVQRDVVVLEVRLLNAVPLDPEQSLKFVVDPARGGELEFPVGWPTPADRCTLVLRAESRPSPTDDEGHRVTLSAALTLEDGEPIRRNRMFDVVEGTTTLFEVYRQAERPLTLGIQSSIETQTVLPGAPRIGARVLFDLAIQRVLDGTVVPLETNRLSTFIGEPVSYSFKLGPTGVGDAARLTLRPTSVSGEVVEIDVTINGSLPGKTGPEFVSRNEQWFASRNATTTAAFETGDPPTGYRFLVTPRF